MDNLTIFDIMYDEYKIKNKIRLIEFFAGIGAQAKALKNLGANFEHYKTCEWAIPSILAYSEIHHKELPNYGIDFTKDITKEEIIEHLYKKGVSSNYNEPMDLEQIKRLKEDKLRSIYNSIIWNNNLVNIQQVHGEDLEIVDTDKYTYILTYSFPCQDLSLAGKGAGMSRDGGTRSGMLWEVERILDECNELGTLPNLLLMENVPQVIGEKNIKDFQSWRDKLESLGYSNYIEVLNAKDYGIPQNRQRAFMISILGEYSYTFPKKIPLELKLKDMLESNVDEKYYLSDKQIGQIINWEAQQEPLETLGKPVSPTLTTRSGAYAAGMVLTSNLEIEEEKQVGEQLLKIKEATKKGYRDAYEGDGIDVGGRMMSHRGTVQKGISQTIKTSIDVGVVVQDEPKVLGGIGEKKSNGGTQWYQQDRIYDDNVAISVTTSFNPYYKSGLRIRKLTGKECYRLMNFSDEDCDNARKVLSEAMIYHTAGDSICVNVLEAIFKQLL